MVSQRTPNTVQNPLYPVRRATVTPQSPIYLSVLFFNFYTVRETCLLQHAVQQLLYTLHITGIT